MAGKQNYLAVLLWELSYDEGEWQPPKNMTNEVANEKFPSVG